MRISAIYKIQSIINPERIYIGSAVWVRRRWNTHLSQLRKNKHHSPLLQNHYNKYGEHDLVFIIIEPCFPEFLFIREQHYLDSLHPAFNINKTAEAGWLGKKHTEQSKNKISASRMGIIPYNKGLKLKAMSDETKRRISQSKKGKPLTNEHKQKISALMKGREITLIHRQRISESVKRARGLNSSIIKAQ